MPDYTYLKQGIKSVEQEKMEFFRQHQKIYHTEKEKIVAYLIKRINDDIEEAVKEYYRYGESRKIKERGVFLKKHVYHTHLFYLSNGFSEDVARKKTCIFCRYLGDGDYDGETVYAPDKSYCESLVAELHAKLAHKGTKVFYQGEGSYRSLYVEADLGKL